DEPLPAIRPAHQADSSIERYLERREELAGPAHLFQEADEGIRLGRSQQHRHHGDEADPSSPPTVHRASSAVACAGWGTNALATSSMKPVGMRLSRLTSLLRGGTAPGQCTRISSPPCASQ